MSRFFKGVLVGIGIGLLVAPKQWEETRRFLGQLLGKVMYRSMGQLPPGGYGWLCCPTIYEPDKWNDHTPGVLGVQDTNNCYNYACNMISKEPGDGAQPGYGSGHRFIEPATCQSIHDAVISDGLTLPAFPLKGDIGSSTFPHPGELPMCQSRCEHLVALAIDPVDPAYHWFRRDDNGMWSHKPSVTGIDNKVTNLDWSGYSWHGKPISDPSSDNCNRGRYTEFCGFYCVSTYDKEVTISTRANGPLAIPACFHWGRAPLS